jgi:hypothetical protein
MMAGVDIVHVPYRGGGPALVDLMSGRVQLMFDNLPTSLEFIRAGKLRALAVTTAARSPVVPDLPTVADFRSTRCWQIRRQKRDLSTSARRCCPGRLPTSGNLIASETEKWGKVIKFAGIKPE